MDSVTEAAGWWGRGWRCSVDCRNSRVLRLLTIVGVGFEEEAGDVWGLEWSAG